MNREQRTELRDRLQARFRQLQEDEGWTQEALAEEARLHPRVVSDFVRSASVPNEKTLRALASALKVSPTAEEELAKFPPEVESHLKLIGLLLAKSPLDERRKKMEEIVKVLMT